MTDLDNLLDQLADEPRPTPAQAQAKAMPRFAAPLAVSAIVCAALVVAVFAGIFPAAEMAQAGPLAVKWVFSLSLLILAPYALFALGKPGRETKWHSRAVALPFIAVALLTAASFASSSPQTFPGETWRQCLSVMCFVSPIAFAGAIVAMRGLAPTNLKRSGMIAGFFGGAVAMSVYAPFCPERSMAYMAIFYVMPMLAMGAIGYLTGPRLLRW